MNEPLSPEEIVKLQYQLDSLRKEHAALEQKIQSLHPDPRSDDLYIHRLKREKLAVRDQIVRVEALLTPNIIA